MQQESESMLPLQNTSKSTWDHKTLGEPNETEIKRMFNMTSSDSTKSDLNDGQRLLLDEHTDIDFIYADCDSHMNEMAELYSYSEYTEHFLNFQAYEELAGRMRWKSASEEDRQSFAFKLCENIEMSNYQQRNTAARCVLYLLQGCWMEIESDNEQSYWSLYNCMLLCRLDIWTLFLELLNIELENNSNVVRKMTFSINDSQELRVILTVLCTIAELIRHERETESNSPYKEIVDAFYSDIITVTMDEDSIILQLLNMITKFCGGSAPHFPMKKVLLLLWKLLLMGLGGSKELKQQKIAKRIANKLDTCHGDTIDVAVTMRPSSPPPIMCMLNLQDRRNKFRPKRGLRKQTSLNDIEDSSLNNEMSGETMADEAHRSKDMVYVFGQNDGEPFVQKLVGNELIEVTPVSENNCDDRRVPTADEADKLDDAIAFFNTDDCNNNGSDCNSRLNVNLDEVCERQVTFCDRTDGNVSVSDDSNKEGYEQYDPEEEYEDDVQAKQLPWSLKVRQRDMDQYLDGVRMKFVGYTLPQDRVTRAGLPDSIQESLKIFDRHLYVSLAELQIEREDEIHHYPMTKAENDVELTPAEILYKAMLPYLPQYMIALLKILLAAAPTSKAKAESINLMADVLPEDVPLSTVQSMKLTIDINRHKEIITKAVSAILLLLLKHFKLNHIYQFEFMSQHLVFANCIPLVLKFFNQNILGYVGSRNIIPLLDFPLCIIGDHLEITPENIYIGDTANYSWRNMFSCINLLRILNKLTKWKHSRIMMLVVFKSAAILKRTLKIRHPLTQLYVLKLLKMQAKYLGRQWRKANMKTISAIYQKVRHRLNDDWAFGNDLDARPWDFQAEECILRAAVDRFNNRRYVQFLDTEYYHEEENVNSILGVDLELSDYFKENYVAWMEDEVFLNPINWDEILA